MSFNAFPTPRARPAAWAAISLVIVVLFRAPLGALSRLALGDERYNYLGLVPSISLALLFLERRRAFGHARYCPAIGLPLMLLGALTYFASGSRWIGEYRLSLAVLGAVVVWNGAFALCYGARVFRTAAFPILFLLCMVPPPAFVLDKAAEMLRAGSAAVGYVMFRLAGVPVLKEGFAFSLPGADIDVARQCSGIRSSASLLIAGLLAGHVFLRRHSRQMLLVVCIVPIVILKNAARIVAISLLGIYVDQGFFHGSLHRYGGLAVSFVAVAILVPVVWLLRKSEPPTRLDAE